MKNLKRCLVVLLVLAMSLSCLMITASAEEYVVASGVCGSNLTWTLNDEGVLRISGTGAMSNYTGGGAPWYNYRSSIDKIEIESGVTTIGQYAFYRCNANYVYIPNTVTSIGYEAFWYCTITSVDIPASVTDIGSYAFESCAYLTSVTFYGDAPAFGSYVFSGVTADVYYPRAKSSWSVYAGSNLGGSLNWIAVGKIDTPVVTTENTAKTGKIVVKWEAIEGACAYVVYRAESKSGTYKELSTVTGSTKFTDSSAAAGKRYYYKVQAIAENPEHNSEMSSAVSRMCDLPRPVVSASNDAQTGKIKLSWNKVDGALAYKIYYSTTGEENSFKTLKSECTGTSYTHTAAKAGTVYYYRVKALAADDTADSANSSTVERACDCAAPEITATNNSDTGKIVLSWKSVSGADGYKVYRATSKNGDYSLKATVTSGTTWTDKKAIAGNRYYYKVKAIDDNSSCNSAYSNIVNRLCDCAKPEVKVSGSSTSYIKISWESVSGAEKYAVYRATSKNGSYSKLCTTESTSKKDTTVKVGKTYYYKVKALADDSSANSVYSDVVSAKAAIKAPTMKTTASVTSSTIEISWEKVSGANGYYVYRRASTSDSWKKVKTITSGSTTSFKDTDRSGRYYYCVEAYKTISGTKYSSLKSDPIRVRTLSKPSNVTVVANNDDMSNTISWKKVSGATDYQVYYKVGSSGSWKKAGVADGTSFVHSVDHGKYYYYKVRARYRNDGVTSNGAYREGDTGYIHYYYPNVDTWLSNESDPSTRIFLMHVDNNGVAPIYFYGDGARSLDADYDTYDRSLTLYDYEYYSQNRVLRETERVCIQPGESAWILLIADTETWYDQKTKIVMDCYYDGMWYTTYTSSYYGFHYYQQ